MSLYDPETGPLVWPECTECHATYTLEYAWSMSKGMIWVWRCPCKCGKRKKPAPAPARMMDANGPIADGQVS